MRKSSPSKLHTPTLLAASLALAGLSAMPAAANAAPGAASIAAVQRTASETLLRATGLKEPTPEELAKLRVRTVKQVNPNALAIDRKNKELKQKGMAPLDGRHGHRPENEIEIHANAPANAAPAGSNGPASTGTSVAGTAAAPANATTAMVGAIPAAVDNSTLAAFPPIGNQGHEGSCTAFAVSYYQASHETCLARGCNNKTSSATVFSPKWTYNMVNGGSDTGSGIGDIFAIHLNNGAIGIDQLPYVAGDYRAWDMNPADWRNALQYRMNPSTTFSSLTSSAGMANLKQHLANGHVANVITYVYSWVFTSVAADPAAPSPYAGQAAMSYMNGTAGAHLMTIVGYDDSVWIDVNNNGVVDAGEKGAWKIANSWGAGWGNAGFIWVAYDAMRATTAVAGGPASTTRNSVFWSEQANSITAKPAYKPRLIAEFTVNHGNRGQMSVSGGVSSSTANTPSTLASTAVMQTQGGAYAFDGGATPIDGTFVLDLSDVIPATTSATKYYLKAQDSVSGSPLTVKSLKLVNTMLNQDIGSSTSLPISSDASTQYAAVNYTYSDGNTPPVAQIQATTTNLNGGVNVTFDGSTSFDANGSIVAYNWDFGDGSVAQTNSAVTHFYGRAGNFTALLTVTDNQGALGTASYVVSIKDVTAPTAPGTPAAVLARSGKGNHATTVVDLSWPASADDVGVAAYEVYRNGARVATSSGASYRDTGTVTGGGNYTYYVVARDAAGNRSPASGSVVVTR